MENFNSPISVSYIHGAMTVKDSGSLTSQNLEDSKNERVFVEFTASLKGDKTK